MESLLLGLRDSVDHVGSLLSGFQRRLGDDPLSEAEELSEALAGADAAASHCEQILQRHEELQERLEQQGDDLMQALDEAANHEEACRRLHAEVARLQEVEVDLLGQLRTCREELADCRKTLRHSHQHGDAEEDHHGEAAPEKATASNPKSVLMRFKSALAADKANKLQSQVDAGQERMRMVEEQLKAERHSAREAKEGLEFWRQRAQQAEAAAEEREQEYSKLQNLFDAQNEELGQLREQVMEEEELPKEVQQERRPTVVGSLAMEVSPDSERIEELNRRLEELSDDCRHLRGANKAEAEVAHSVSQALEVTSEQLRSLQVELLERDAHGQEMHTSALKVVEDQAQELQGLRERLAHEGTQSANLYTSYLDEIAELQKRLQQQESAGVAEVTALKAELHEECVGHEQVVEDKERLDETVMLSRDRLHAADEVVARVAAEEHAAQDVAQEHASQLAVTVDELHGLMRHYAEEEESARDLEHRANRQVEKLQEQEAAALARESGFAEQHALALSAAQLEAKEELLEQQLLHEEQVAAAVGAEARQEELAAVAAARQREEALAEDLAAATSRLMAAEQAEGVEHASAAASRLEAESMEEQLQKQRTTLEFHITLLEDELTHERLECEHVHEELMEQELAQGAAVAAAEASAASSSSKAGASEMNEVCLDEILLLRSQFSELQEQCEVLNETAASTHLPSFDSDVAGCEQALDVATHCEHVAMDELGVWRENFEAEQARCAYLEVVAAVGEQATAQAASELEALRSEVREAGRRLFASEHEAVQLRMRLHQEAGECESLRLEAASLKGATKARAHEVSLAMLKSAGLQAALDAQCKARLETRETEYIELKQRFAEEKREAVKEAERREHATMVRLQQEAATELGQARQLRSWLTMREAQLDSVQELMISLRGKSLRTNSCAGAYGSPRGSDLTALGSGPHRLRFGGGEVNAPVAAAVSHRPLEPAGWPLM